MEGGRRGWKRDEKGKRESARLPDVRRVVSDAIWPRCFETTDAIHFQRNSTPFCRFMEYRVQAFFRAKALNAAFCLTSAIVCVSAFFFFVFSRNWFHKTTLVQDRSPIGGWKK